MNIGCCLVTVAKLSGLCQGLIMAWNHGVCWLIVKVFSLCATQLVANCVVSINGFYLLVSFIKELTNRAWKIPITYMYCEANFIADFIASYASSLLQNPSASVSQIIAHDMYGLFILV